MSPEESRMAALEAARGLLMESGLQSVTLKAVASRIGRTHANLLHHFGSAAGLRCALALHLAQEVCDHLLVMIEEHKAGRASLRDTIDLLFDVFSQNGGAELCAWLILDGDRDHLAPLKETFRQVVDAVAPEELADQECKDAALQITLLAAGDAFVGKVMTSALDLPRDQARVLAEGLFSSILLKQAMAEEKLG